jgi:hypothetical protein
MIEFVGPLYNLLQRFTNHWHPVIFRLDTPLELFWLPTELSIEFESESYITIDGQSASLSWNKAPIWGLRPDFYYCLTVADLLMWGVLSDERTDLSFAIATGLRQRSHSRVRVSWESRPYFTISDSRLSFLSPPTTRMVTEEVFDPASTRGRTVNYCWLLFI